MMFNHIIAVAFFVSTTSALFSSCNIPPRFWCDSKEIARSCGVEIQCAEWFWNEGSNAKPVKVDVYFESLCPDSIEYIVQMLYPTWKKFRDSDIMELKIYSYGNANETKNSNTEMWDYTCQHGPRECVGNLIENCIQYYTNYNILKYFPIFYCMESAKNPVNAAEKCVTDAGLQWSEINKCASGPEGNALMHKTAMATDSLKPKQIYVPWVVINDRHTKPLQKDAQNNLPKLLCDTYRGAKPIQCKDYVESHPMFH
uniref:gamma-interferon-inducible lysosomal thiol reductase-like n=1 Tax=Styela clava TaxID=7725 RepID=UPI00193A98F8|nr:gamma-interferon-inducible lysosomal thiol reductase-like [Styela clava]